VDIFFVLSGYLITSMILGELDTGRFQVFDFLERRARRILPALTVAVFSTLIAGWFLFLPSDFRELGQSVVALALLASNIYFWRESDYWAQDQARPLLHTWSLAVEEQFYLLFPFVLIGIRRFAPHISAKAIFLLLCVSFGLGIYCSHHYPSASFYSLPTRAWEFLIGSLLAVIPTRKAHSPMLMEALSWAGALTILYTVIWGGHGSQLGWIISLLPGLGTAMVIWACRTSARFCRPHFFLPLSLALASACFREIHLIGHYRTLGKGAPPDCQRCHRGLVLEVCGNPLSHQKWAQELCEILWNCHSDNRGHALCGSWHPPIGWNSFKNSCGRPEIC